MGLPDSDFELLRTTGELIYEYDGYTDGETVHLAGAELNRLLNKMRELASALRRRHDESVGLEAQLQESRANNELLWWKREAEGGEVHQ